MDPLTFPLVVLGVAFAVVLVFRMRGLVGSVKALAESLQDVARGRRRPTGTALPTDERFRDVGDDRPRVGRPDPYA